MGITIKEIAEKARVHRSTVDKVIHHRPGVSDAVRARVQKLLDDEGYKANPIGKALNLQKKKLVLAAILLEVDALADIKRGIVAAASEFAGFNLEVQTAVVEYPDVVAQVERIRHFAKQKVDGIVISPLNHPDVWQAIDETVALGVAVVTTNVDLAGSRRLCYVGQDAVKSGRVAAKMMGLFMAHHGNIAVVVGSTANLLSMNKREQGFRQFIRESEPDLEIVRQVETHEDPQTAYGATKELLRARPDVRGLFITCGCVPEVCRAVQECANRPVSIVCYERYPQIESLLQEGKIACTISSDLEKQGYQAVKVLFDYFMYGQPPPDRIFMDIGIILGENL